MNIPNKILIRVTLVLVAAAGPLAGQDFYQNLLEGIRQDYQIKRYERVLDSLEIAEFGLRSDADRLQEVYGYYLATCFQLRRMEQARQYHQRLLEDSGRTRLPVEDFPDAIREDLAIADLLIRKELLRSPDWEQTIGYETLFYRTVMESAVLDNDRLAGIHLRLKQINRKDRRRDFVTAVIARRNGQAQKALSMLQDTLALPGIGLPEIKDQIYYRIALAHYDLKQYVQILEVIQKIEDPLIIQNIQEIIKKNKISSD